MARKEQFHLKRIVAGSYRHTSSDGFKIDIFQIPSYWVVRHHGKDIHFRLRKDAASYAEKVFANHHKA